MGTHDAPRNAEPRRNRELIGRTREQAIVDALLDAPHRLPITVVLRGEAGIGKSTIWERAVEGAQARGFLCLRARPAESEAGLAFAALGDLLTEVRPLFAGRLPAPQQSALDVALLLEEPIGGIPDQRTVGVAALSALRILAQRQPLMIAIDDEQWVDSASAAVLGFALRRLSKEPIAILLARRAAPGDTSVHGSEALLGEQLGALPIERVDVAGVSLGALHAIVVERFGTSLSRSRLHRLHYLSRGNPLLAIELVRAMNAGRLQLESIEGGAADMDRLVGARLDDLPTATRILLATVAAASKPTVDLLRKVHRTAQADIGPAIAAGIVHLEGGSEVKFMHPLLATAAYAGAPADKRRDLHARLAELSAEPVERARHLAVAAQRPDEAVAAEVEEAAVTVFRRGAPAPAAELAALAVRLTSPEDPAATQRRISAQAEYLFEAGDTAASAALLEPLIAVTPAGPGRAALLALLGRIRHFGNDVEAGTALNERALAESTADHSLTASLHEGLAWGLFLMRRDLPRAAAHARHAVRAARKANDDVALGEALAAQAITSAAIGRGDERIIARAMALEPAFRGLRVLRHPSYAKAYILACSDRLAEARQLLEALLARAEEQGDESAVPSILVQLSMAEILAGEWAAADEHAQTGYSLADRAGQAPSAAALLSRRALLAVLRGNLDAGEALATNALKLAVGDAGPALDAADQEQIRRAPARGGEVAAWALGAAALARGRFDSAYSRLWPLAERLLGSGLREPGELRFMPDTVEASIGLGRLDSARSLVDRMDEMATLTGRRSTAGLAARSRAMLRAHAGDVGAAVAAAGQAVQLLHTEELPFELARAEFVLGELQRRAQQKRAARESLTSAARRFADLGATGWAARADSEQARVGGRPVSAGALTPTESRVAALVSEGMANKEVATALGITTKTVELHLSHVYAKLDIGSRTELVRLMASQGVAAPQ